MPVVATSTYETPLIGLPETFDIKLVTATNLTIFLIFVLSSINILFWINLPIERLLVSGTGKYPKLSAPKFCWELESKLVVLVIYCFWFNAKLVVPLGIFWLL